MAGEENIHWSTRLACAHDTQSRTRLAFIAITIISIAIIVAEFNSYFSWYVQFLTGGSNFPLPITDCDTHQNIDGCTFPQHINNAAAEAQKALIDEWIKSNRVTVSLLGVNFGMSDAAILGSISLFILSLWFFACIRRENHLIADLLIDAKKAISLSA